MISIDRKSIFASIGIILVFVGVILTIHYSVPLLSDPTQNVNFQEFQSKQITRNFLIDYKSDIVSDSPTMGSGNVTFAITFGQDNNVFVGDYVSYIARASIGTPTYTINGSIIHEQNSDVSIVVLVVDPQIDENTKYNSTMILDKIRNQDPNAFILYPQNLVAYRANTMGFFTEGEKILHVFVLQAGVVSQDKTDNIPIFKVQSSSERLQEETNVFQTIANNQIIGLSELAIFLAFVVIGCDILFRIYLDPYTDDMKKKSESNEKSWKWFSNRN